MSSMWMLLRIIRVGYRGFYGQVKRTAPDHPLRSALVLLRHAEIRPTLQLVLADPGLFETRSNCTESWSSPKCKAIARTVISSAALGKSASQGESCSNGFMSFVPSPPEEGT